jgi:N6-L-threonylcarbamoyladenine synthase
MLVLGIESSCDETGAAVVQDDGRVLSDVVQTQIDLHAKYGGIIPELAARDHLRSFSPVVREALERAKVELSDLDAIAVTCRPGLVGALLVGVQAVKGLAWATEKPLVGVDHLVGHILSVFLRRGDRSPEPPAFPFVSLLVSGGHTALYRVDGPHVSLMRELGATRDDAAGEAFDKVGKLLGLGYPGGPVIDRLAAKGKAGAVPLSRPMARKDSLEFSFSGLKTQVAQLIEREGVPTTEERLADICASFQDVVTETLTRKLFRAAEDEGIGTVVIGGGVAANQGLRARVQAEAQKRGMKAVLPEIASCTDNAAMIAYAGAMSFARGEVSGLELAATSRTSLPQGTRKGRGAR